MTDKDFWAGLGAILSTIIAGLSWFWNIGVLQILFSVLTGAFITYLVQSKLQDRIEKRRTAVENIKKIYAPFFLEIKNTKENLLLNLETKGIGNWTTIINQPEIFCVETGFKNQMIEFCKRANSFIEKINGIKRIVADIFWDGVKEIYYPAFADDMWVSLSRSDLAGFHLSLLKPIGRDFAEIEKCAILKNDPIKSLQEKTTFLAAQLEFVLDYEYKTKTGGGHRQHRVNISDLDPPFKDFWKDMLEKVHENIDVSRFDAERQELIEIADNLLEKLGKYIDRYIEIEKI
ncbi:MAG: hypothetical protein H3Z50_02575 [archaeon]|nr:hypothetical protein [archaeon]